MAASYSVNIADNSIIYKRQMVSGIVLVGRELLFVAQRVSWLVRLPFPYYTLTNPGFARART